MAKNLFNRYIWLVDAIYKSGGITFDEINQQWRRSYLYENKDIPVRTFHHQRAEIQNLFDIEILCNKTNYKYYIDDNVIVRSKLKTWILDTFSVSNILKESNDINDRIIVENIPSAQKYLTDFLYAIKNDLAVRFDYEPVYLSQLLNITLFPYFVKMYEERWYVYGVRDNEPVVKVYALDRIKGLEITEKHFSLPNDFSPETHLFNSVGIVRNKTEPCEIQIKAFFYYPKYLRTLPLHHSQKELETNANYTVFSYYLCPTTEFYQKILARSEYLQIISPQHVRQEMRKILAKLNDYYNDKKD
jgi:hypothetical protein